MPDLSQFKIPVFAQINDVPKIPTATEPGNGSDLIDRFNKLCDYLSQNLADVATSGNYQDLQNIPSRGQLAINGTFYENVNKVSINGNNFSVSENLGEITITFTSNNEGETQT